MTPYEREILIRTIMGEAANEGPEGWAAVAHVIKNRTVDPRWPGDPASVALQPKQFSAWNAKGQGGNDLVRKYGPGSPQFQQIGAVVDQVFSGQAPDPTGGATHYYAPQGMPGGKAPKWFPKETQERGGAPSRIGNHVFTGKVKGGPPPYGAPRRPNTPTPGLEAPQYETDSPYYRAIPDAPAPVIPGPQPKPQPPGFDYMNALNSMGSLLSAMNTPPAQHAATALQSRALLDDAERKRREWNNSFTWL